MSIRWQVTGLALSLALGLTAQLADAQTRDQVVRFVQLSDRFDAQLPAPRTSGLSDDAKRARAQCILAGMEERYGRDGIRSVMALMQVLARGAQFDDPTIVSFNEAYGGSFNQLVSRCTRRAGGA